jgi:nucleotide-binding universal stress UspA family protein
LVEGSGGKVAQAYLREGEPDAEVVSLGEKIGASVIVTGSKAAHAHCPVLVVRGGA